MAGTRHLLNRLSALPGPGSPQQYRELLGPTVEAILIEAGKRAGALVERQLATSTYRPTPAELRATWQSMVVEDGEARGASIRDRSRRCPYCEGRGQLHAVVWSRRKGADRVRTYSVTCSCPRGLQLLGAEGLQRMSREQFEVKCSRQEAPSEFHDGVIAWHVDDATSAPAPEWARWCPALTPPEGADGSFVAQR
jgi:hypothetical protein